MKTPIDEVVLFCPECEHSEYVHAYRDQLCLFSDCECTGFGVPRSGVVKLHDPDDGSPQPAHDTVRIWDTGD